MGKFILSLKEAKSLRENVPGNRMRKGGVGGVLCGCGSKGDTTWEHSGRNGHLVYLKGVQRLATLPKKEQTKRALPGGRGLYFPDVRGGRLDGLRGEKLVRVFDEGYNDDAAWVLHEQGRGGEEWQQTGKRDG